MGAATRLRHTIRQGRNLYGRRVAWPRAAAALPDDPRADAVRVAVRELARPTPHRAIERRRAELEASGEPMRQQDDRPRTHGYAPPTVGQFTATSSKPVRWCAFLHRLAVELGPSSAVEIGAAVGLSGAYIAAGMDGKFVTIEGSRHCAELAAETYRQAGVTVDLRQGWSLDVLPDVIAEVGPVDFAFLDGGHFEETALKDWAVLKPALSPGAVVVWDDVDWSDEMRRVWARLKPEASWTVTLGNVGVWAA